MAMSDLPPSTTNEGSSVVSAAMLDAGQMREDLKVISDYVKEDLFRVAKFIYKNDDLKYNGKLYKHCKSKCMEKVGGRRLDGQCTTNKDVYLKMVWEEAVKNKMQKQQLSQRRSAVYTVMQSKFMGKWTEDQQWVVWHAGLG